MTRSRLALVASLALGALASSLDAAEVRLFLTQSQEEFRAGELDSISVDPLGILRLAHRAERLAAIEEPFLLSAAALPGNDGWVIGTGNAGRVLKIDRQGKVETLFTTEEPEVFAVWADDKGAVYAGSSPDGKVYRHAGGETSVFYDPDQTYIWEVEGDGKGRLLVATGTEGKLFRVDSGGKGEVLYDSGDAHLRSIAVIGDGEFLVGTAGLGLVLRIDASGQARTVYDAAAPEVVAFTPDGKGGAYFAVLASEASLLDLGRDADRSGSQDKNGEQKQDDDDDDGSKDGEDRDEGARNPFTGGSDSLSAGSRPASFSGARSEVLRWTRDAGAESVWKFTDETVYSLLWLDGRLWVGTGLEGKLYSHQSERMMLEKDVDQSQIVALLPNDSGPAFATTNGAALFRFTRGMERKGTLTSDVFDAGLQSTFGTLHWRGVEPTGTAVRFSARGGMSALPDQTWSDWSSARDGHEISLRDLDQCRYFQWRVELESSSDQSPEVHAVEISYLQSNQPPQIDELTVLDPGQILVPSNFNPQNQVFEPAYPNREGIFTTLEETKDRTLKPLWKRGFRTLRWAARDPNADELTYAVSVRREDDAEGWLEMKDELEEDRYSFDATVLPDGLYRFKVTVSDERDNDGTEGATATRITEAVVIDHSPPTLGEVTRDGAAPSSAPRKSAPEGVVTTTLGGALHVEVEDSWNIVREAVWSADVSPWENAKVDDGLLDSRRETLLLEPKKDAKLLLLRLTDAAFNVFTYDLSQHLEGRR